MTLGRPVGRTFGGYESWFRAPRSHQEVRCELEMPSRQLGLVVLTRGRLCLLATSNSSAARSIILPEGPMEPEGTDRCEMLRPIAELP